MEACLEAVFGASTILKADVVVAHGSHADATVVAEGGATAGEAAARGGKAGDDHTKQTAVNSTPTRKPPDACLSDPPLELERGLVLEYIAMWVSK
jgi:hypothetical protein